MKALTKDQIKDLENFCSDIEKAAEKINEILVNNEVPTNTGAAVTEYAQNICSEIAAVLEDSKNLSNLENYLGEYKFECEGLDMYIEANEISENDGKVMYEGRQGVDWRNSIYWRLWSCEASVFQGAVDSEMYRRID